jgi:hypothetical protein
MENSLQIGRWRISFDPALTAELYAQTPAFACECTDCANFRAAVDDAFSSPFLSLLRQLGVDRRKPAELCHYGTSGEPMPTQGWFHFVGHLESGADAWHLADENTYSLDPEPFPGIKSIGFTSRLSQVPKRLQGHPVVQLEFEMIVPWITAVPLA